MNTTLLLIDDDKDFLSDFSFLLKNNYTCFFANDEQQAFKLMKDKSPDVILLDLMLADGVSGIDVLRKIKSVDDSVPVIIMTDYGSIETAVEALKVGAFDYISKTPNLKELKFIIEKSLQQRLLKYQAESLQNEINKPYQALVGISKEIQKVKELIALFVQSENTVLITGESGVGKELVARQIHYHSNRRNNPFIPINCGALPKELIESELFGYERGAFTGADKRTPGKFEIAEGGTIFLDEISELDPMAQVKFLRILHEKEFTRVGSAKTIKSNVKVIVATNKDLFELVKKGLFREDLFYRLDVLPIKVPPLRNRKEDIPVLVSYFSSAIAKELNKPTKTFSDEALQLFLSYDWPGNIRELKNYIYRLYLLVTDQIIYPKELDFFVNINLETTSETEETPETWERMNELRKVATEKASRRIEKLFVDFLLKKFDGNITKAADYAGINRTNMHKMINKAKGEEL